MDVFTPTLDTVSVCFGVMMLLLTFLISALTDLIMSLSRWIFEKAIRLRDERLGSRPSLWERIRSKIRSFYDVDPS